MRFLLVFIAFWMFACVKSVPQVQKITRTVKINNFCLRGQATYNGKLESVELCTESQRSCERALSLAKMYGRFANLKQVDSCSRKMI